MAPWANDTVMLDAMADVLIANCTRVTLCNAQPTDYTMGNTTYAIGNVTVAGGDFTKADGDTDGRKVTMAQKTGGVATADDTGLFLAFLDVSGTALLWVIDCTSQAVVNGADLTFNAVDVFENRDPTTI